MTEQDRLKEDKLKRLLKSAPGLEPSREFEDRVMAAVEGERTDPFSFFPAFWNSSALKVAAAARWIAGIALAAGGMRMVSGVSAIRNSGWIPAAADKRELSFVTPVAPYSLMQVYLAGSKGRR